MNRIVLAILALFAGLATQVTPAEARLSGKVEIGATLGPKSSTRVTAVAAAAAFRPQPRREAGLIEPVRAMRPLAIAEAPAVQLRIDRARE
jgi:hypothetical protein